MAKTVTTIMPTKPIYASEATETAHKRRVAGYARVSTDADEQAGSYQSQIAYYKKYITSRADWEYVGMYSDEGISATSTKDREGFKRMIDDAMAGKIDLIITKSVSRFARNTVDSLSTVRSLKEKGVEIYFEKENIWTLDSKGELLITIMSSLAQEESRSISENTAWGWRKQFAEGKIKIGDNNLLGYDRDFKINPGQAETVKLIYKLFLMGYSPYNICKELEKRGIKTLRNFVKWNPSTVKSILTNEKYCGDARLQKTFCPNFLEKVRKKNTGELPQYYVEHHHEAIIEPAVFKIVQAEMNRRDGIRHHGPNLYSNKIKCGICGAWYGRKVWGSNTKYRKQVYRCNKKYAVRGKPCQSTHLYENEIAGIIKTAVEKLLSDKDKLRTKIRNIIKKECGTTQLTARLNKVAERYKDSKDKSIYTEYQKLSAEITAREDRKCLLEWLLSKVEGAGKEYDDRIWISLLDHILVRGVKDYQVVFIGGIDIAVK